MEPNAIVAALTKVGAALAVSLSAIGSGLGTGVAGQAAVGAWKKCYAQNKPASFMLVVFVGMPMTQTFYGAILMFTLIGKAATAVSFWGPLGWGLASGLAIGISAWMQGKAAAGACDAFAETGQGFASYMIALGVIESVAIFVMVFTLISV